MGECGHAIPDTMRTMLAHACEEALETLAQMAKKELAKAAINNSLHDRFERRQAVERAPFNGTAKN
jgi:hypothetical protein